MENRLPIWRGYKCMYCPVRFKKGEYLILAPTVKLLCRIGIVGYLILFLCFIIGLIFYFRLYEFINLYKFQYECFKHTSEPGRNYNKEVILHFPEFQDWSFNTGCR